MGDLIAEDAGYEQIARGILDAATQSPAGQWRMPWHALSGGLPENAFTGRRFRSTNLLTLAIAARRKGYGANLWAPGAQWEKKRGRLKPGAEGTVILVPVFDDTGPVTRWNAGTKGIRDRFGPLGGDPAGGEQRRMLGFRQEPWFNIHEVDGVDIRKPAPPSPSEAAVRLDRVLAAWREAPYPQRGPALLFGGHQAYWNPQTDQIMSPPVHAYGDYDGVSGLEYYVITNTHEHIHATGSANRLSRSSLRQYASKNGRAREELVAELGAAFLAGRYRLGTVLRPDHAQYVASWLNSLADREQRKTFFWAVREAERAAGFILAQAGETEA